MLRIRPASSEDVDLILQFIRWLAEYERSPESAVATREDLVRDGFGTSPKFHVLIAEWDDEAAGFAFYFFNYSTWVGRPGLFLEDLFVRPEYRGRGIGKALLAELAAVAVSENCARMNWQVLDWNQPAIDFYERLGGQILREWLTVRLSGESIRSLAEHAKSRARDAAD